MALFHKALTKSFYSESSYSMHYSLFFKKSTYINIKNIRQIIRFMKFLSKQYLSISLTSEIGSILHSTPVHQATIIPSAQLYFFKALIITSIMISKTSVLAFHFQCFLDLNIFRRLLKSACFQNYIIPPARSLF